MRKYLNKARKAFAIFIVRHFHFFHSYEFVGGKFIGAYFPDFMDKNGLQTFIVCQNAKCNKCGKEIQYKYQIKGDYNLTHDIVEKNYCA
jgi:hypothetical protein